MAILEVKLELPERLARKAMAAGLLEPKAMRDMLKNAMQRQAARALLDGAARASKAGSKPMSMKAIQREVSAVRRERRTRTALTK